MERQKRTPGTGAPGALEVVVAAKLPSSSKPKIEKQPSIVAEIELANATRLRISLTSWRDSRKVELRIATSQIPGCFFPTRDGFEIDVALLPALIKALQKANAAASSRQGGTP